MHNLLILFIFLVAATGSVIAEVRQTPEAVVVSHVAGAISAYSKGFGRMPSTWEEVGRIIDLEVENKAMSQTYGRRIQERYQFITRPMAIPHEEDLQYRGTKVLLIRTVPLTHKGGDSGKLTLRRYLIYEDNAGYIRNASMPEEKVQVMLAKSGVRLIPPVGASATESDEVIPRGDGNPSESDRHNLPMAPKAPATSPSPLPSSPVTQTPAATVEQKAPVWPWVIGIAALTVIALLVWKRRT